MNRHAKEFIELIGQSTAMQFEDMNARDHARTYKKYIQRIDEMERILRFLFDQLSRVPGARKGTHGVSTDGVAANVMFFDRGTFWILPLTYFYLLPGRTFFLNLSKYITIAAAPLVSTPFVRNQGATVEKNNVEDFLVNASAYKLDDLEGNLKQLYTQYVKFMDSGHKIPHRKSQK